MAGLENGLAKSSERYAGLYAFFSKRSIPEMIDLLMDMGARQLSWNCLNMR
jgi:hypothetical protein